MLIFVDFIDKDTILLMVQLLYLDMLQCILQSVKISVSWNEP